MKNLIDLHLHLDGSLSEECVKELCRMQDITEPDDIKKLLTCPKDCHDLNEYLKCFDFPLSLLQTADAISYSVERLCEELKALGFIYAEIRFAPQLHTRLGLSEREVTAAACMGLRYNYKLILCCMRGSMQNEKTVKLCPDFMGKGVVALDLAGAEALYPTRDHRHLFELAAKEKIPYTIHAGEATGAQSVREAVEMGASRIGHGVHAIEDESVLAILAKNRIPLEMCPSSNLNTKAITDIRDYPLPKYLSLGIPVTINSDNMSVSDTHAGKELQLIEDTFGTNKALLLKNAADAAFSKVIF